MVAKAPPVAAVSAVTQFWPANDRTWTTEPNLASDRFVVLLCVQYAASRHRSPPYAHPS